MRSMRSAGRGRRAVDQGLIGPWDPTPPPGSAGYLDFSGTARPQDINATDWWFPLGRYVLPRHPWQPGQPIGISLAEANRHTLVVGPTRAGKTAGIIAPWIIEGYRAGYHVVAFDLKGGGDLERDITRYRDSLADHLPVRLTRWDYKQPGRSKSWNFIGELDTDSALSAAAEAICGRPRDNDPNRNFHLRDIKWAKGVLELAYDTQRALTVRDILGLLADRQLLRDTVSQYSGSRGANRLSDLVSLPAAEYGKATQFLATYFDVLNNDGFVMATTRRQTDMKRLSSGDAAVTIVNTPVVDGDLSQAVRGLFLALLLNRRYSEFGGNPQPLLLVLDESPRLQDRVDLGQILSLAAGANVSVVLAAQELEQFDEAKRAEICGNCGTLVLLAGTNPTSTDYVMKRLGNRVQATLSGSDSYARGSGRSTGYSLGSSTVPVLGHNELANPPTGQFGATVLNNRLSIRPVLVDLTRLDLLGPRTSVTP